MVRQQHQTRLDEDVAKRVEDYQDEHNISQAEALRRLIRTGLDQAEADDEPKVEDIQDDLDEILSRLDQDDKDEKAGETNIGRAIQDDEPLRVQFEDTNRINRRARIAGGIAIMFLLSAILIINVV
jgi:hypothetical protein